MPQGGGSRTRVSAGQRKGGLRPRAPGRAWTGGPGGLPRALGLWEAQEPSDQPLSAHSYGDFQSYGRQRKTRAYICKPDSGCQGRGIFITRNPRDIKPGEHMICQQYISKVKGTSAPPCPSASTGVPCLPKPQRTPVSASYLFCHPRYPGGHMEPWLRVSMLGFELEFFHFLDIPNSGKCFTLSVPRFPRLLMGTIPFIT